MDIRTRMKNPAMLVPNAMEAIQALVAAIMKSGLSRTTMDLVHLRASQINGCGTCIYSGTKSAIKSGESEERLFAVSAWRHSTVFSDDERAALALAEAVTRLADRDDAVPDELWDEVAKHYDETELASLVLWITTTNLFNRLNVTTRQVPGSWS